MDLLSRQSGQAGTAVVTTPPHARVGNGKGDAPLRHLITFPVALLAALSLSACVETTGQTQVASIEGPVAAVITRPPQGEAVRPGSRPVSLDQAVQLFQQVCVANPGNLKAAEAVVRGLPFRQASTGTWFHQNLDLSIKLIPERRACSMVFGSRENPLQLSLALAVASTVDGKVDLGFPVGSRTRGPNGTAFEFGSTSATSNRTYFHAVLYK